MHLFSTLFTQTKCLLEINLNADYCASDAPFQSCALHRCLRQMPAEMLCQL